MERLGGWTCHGVRFASSGRGRAARHTTGREEGRECRWGWSTHGFVWVCAIGGVAVAHNGAGDVRWVAGGRTEREGAQSVWVGERAGRHVPHNQTGFGCLAASKPASGLKMCGWQGEWEVRTGQTCVNGREGGRDASHSGWTVAWCLTMSKSRCQVFLTFFLGPLGG